MLLGLVALLTQPASAELHPPASLTAAAPSSPLNDRDLLLYSVALDQLTLTDALAAYGDPNDPLIPVGELSRLLDLDIDVSPAEGRITGNLGEERASLIIDARSGLARLRGNAIPLRPTDIAASNSDIYIRASALERIMPVKFDISGEALAITLRATEKLPIQARLERIARLRQLGQPADGEPAMLVRSPYKLFSPPSFDVAAELGRDTRRLRPFASRYDLRFAGDLLYANLQGYVGSDDAGRPQTARFLIERRSADGGLPLGATRISGGDVFTPALPIGIRSVGGRGISFTTVPLETASVFNTIDLRGELPLGFDVELYVNDVLRSGERTPVNGRYEFLAVPLSRGVNVIRIVTYGPRGERSEIVRVINVGGGQLRKGESQFEFGLVDQGRDVVEFNPSSAPSTSGVVSSGLRFAGTAAYGLTRGTTLVGGAAVYPSIVDDHRALATLGIRSSIAGFAIRADGAADSAGGRAIGFGAAGQPFGVSMTLDDTEYRGGFVDETINILSPDRDLLRHSALTLDFALPPIAGRRIPLTLRGTRDEFVDGGDRWIASARASASIFDALVSAGLDYQRTTVENGKLDERLVGNVSASKFIDYKWQVRSAVDFDLRPASKVRAASLTADRNFSDRFSFRLGLGQAFADNHETSGQLGGVYRLPFGELTFAGDFGLHNRDWGMSMRFAFGSLFNPASGRYVMSPPGAASSGSAVVEAYVDRDGDGRLGLGDEPAKGVLVQGGRTDVTTDESGRALITGVGAGPSAMLSLSTKDIPLMYVRDTPSRVKFAPRPGEVVKIPYAIQPVGEVYARFVTNAASGASVGLSALRVRLSKANKEPILGVTEYDGSVVFSDVPPGTYTIELDPAQAEKLRMVLQQTAAVQVKPDTSVSVEANVQFVH